MVKCLPQGRKYYFFGNSRIVFLSVYGFRNENMSKQCKDNKRSHEMHLDLLLTLFIVFCLFSVAGDYYLTLYAKRQYMEGEINLETETEICRGAKWDMP